MSHLLPAALPPAAIAIGDTRLTLPALVTAAGDQAQRCFLDILHRHDPQLDREALEELYEHIGEQLEREHRRMGVNRTLLEPGLSTLS
jgi:hypothetical protein